MDTNKPQQASARMERHAAVNSKTCNQPGGCDRPVVAKGFCKKHYRQYYQREKRKSITTENRKSITTNEEKVVALFSARDRQANQIDLFRLPSDISGENSPRYAISNLSAAQTKVIMLSLARMAAQQHKGSMAHQMLASIPIKALFAPTEPQTTQAPAVP
jgi:hypothetical protein